MSKKKSKTQKAKAKLRKKLREEQGVKKDLVVVTHPIKKDKKKTTKSTRKSTAPKIITKEDKKVTQKKVTKKSSIKKTTSKKTTPKKVVKEDKNETSRTSKPNEESLILVEKGGVKMFKNLEEKVKGYFYHHYKKYAVSYEIEGDRIKVISNIGLYRYVKNTKANIKKLDEALIKNKIAIEDKIDDYERTNSTRVKILLFNILMIGLSGLSIILAFFTGSYLLFLASIVAFCVCVFASTTTGLTYLILVQEIRNLKRATGYKKELEIEMPKIDMPKIKGKLKELRG